MATEHELREDVAGYTAELTRARSADEPILEPRIPIDRPLPIDPQILPWLLTVSGLYTLRAPVLVPQSVLMVRPGAISEPETIGGAQLSPVVPIPWWRRREELRVDVDGHYPQMTVSGTIFTGLTERLHWIASVAPAGPNQWAGAIWYKEGTGSALPQTDVHITATRSIFPAQQRVIVRYSGGGALEVERVYNFASTYYHLVDFEFDRVEGTTRTMRIDTCAHPNRPATLPCESPAAACRCRAPAPTASGGTARCTTRCRPIGRASPTRRNGRCGCCSPPSTRWATTSAASCSTI
jgi:hypothetical protein